MGVAITIESGKLETEPSSWRALATSSSDLYHEIFQLPFQITKVLRFSTCFCWSDDCWMVSYTLDSSSIVDLLCNYHRQCALLCTERFSLEAKLFPGKQDTLGDCKLTWEKVLMLTESCCHQKHIQYYPSQNFYSWHQIVWWLADILWLGPSFLISSWFCW